MRKKHKSSTNKSIHDEHDEKSAPSVSRSREHPDSKNENPPRTTTSGWFTAPKFGSSTSGGGEIEPGTEGD
jgi:hypothetical protein